MAAKKNPPSQIHGDRQRKFAATMPAENARAARNSGSCPPQYGSSFSGAFFPIAGRAANAWVTIAAFASAKVVDTAAHPSPDSRAAPATYPQQRGCCWAEL